MTDAEAPRSAPQATPDRTQARFGAADALAAFGLAAFAFALRCLEWRSVLTPDGVRLVGPDAHYHLRRIVFGVENFPALPLHDAYLRFPDGGRSIWSPAFDWSLAGLARVVAGPGDPAAVERIAIWVPPLLGALAVIVVFGIGRSAFGRRAGIAAAAVLAFLPAHAGYSRLGFVDHHAAVALLCAALLATLTGWVAARRPAAVQTTALGVCMGAGLALWPGCIGLVALAQSCILVVIVRAPPANAARRCNEAALAHAVAFAVVTPAALGPVGPPWSPLSPVVLSAFQPLWLGLPVVGFATCALLFRTHKTSAVFRAIGLAVTLGLPAVASLAAAPVREGVAEAMTWLLRAESFQATVSESLPLFSDGEGGLHATRAHAQLGALVWAIPLLVFYLARRGARDAAAGVVAVFLTGLALATVAQFRFANSLSVALALAVGAAVEDFVHATQGPSSRWKRGLALAALALLLAPAAAPHLRAVRSAAATTSPHSVALHAAAAWLREHSPATAGWLDPEGSPEYGVLTAWGDGHVVRYVAQRPVVQDNFGDDVGRERFDQAEAYFRAASEAEALAIARDLRVRYVLARGSGSGHAPEPYRAESMLVRLYRLRGAAGGLRRGYDHTAPSFVPGLEQHRLVYESPDAPGEDGGRYKLFEIVPGAAVRGRAAPGAVVEAQLPLDDEDGRRFEYRVLTRADAEGRYRIRVPYPSGEFPGRYRAAGPYRLQSEGRNAPLAVSEAQVREGALLEGPDLAG